MSDKNVGQKCRIQMLGLAGAGAINVILIVYVIMAFMEDAGGGEPGTATSKKKS